MLWEWGSRLTSLTFAITSGPMSRNNRTLLPLHAVEEESSGLQVAMQEMSLSPVRTQDYSSCKKKKTLRAGGILKAPRITFSKGLK